MSEPPRADDYPVAAESLPDRVITQGKYTARFASTSEQLDAVQRLRFEVFNLEMGEGLQESYATGRDRDRFDAVCHHLLVTEEPSGKAVGTYRMQTNEMAARYGGFYSAEEFTLEDLPPEIIARSVEVGRASVAKAYRNRIVLFLLWRGLALYMSHNRKRFLFGCCSVSSQDPVEGKRVMEHLERRGHLHPTCRVRPQPGWECYDDGLRLSRTDRERPVDMPRLFSLYLRYGGQVCGPPALDRFFKTIDYLVLFDVDGLDDQSRRMYFE